MLRTFGFAALLDAAGHPVEGLRRKDLALLIYLCVEGAGAHSRSRLSALLWGDSQEARARHSLTQSLRRIREVVPDPALVVQRDTVQWRGRLRCDALELQEAAERLEPLSMSIYPGDFLAGFAVGRGAQDFELWADEKRAHYRTQMLNLLDRLGGAAEGRGDWSVAFELGRRAVEIEQIFEEGHRRVMRAWAALGERGLALQHYNEFSNWLDRELEEDPDAATQALAEVIRRDAARSIAATGTAPAPESAERFPIDPDRTRWIGGTTDGPVLNDRTVSDRASPDGAHRQESGGRNGNGAEPGPAQPGDDAAHGAADVDDVAEPPGRRTRFGARRLLAPASGREITTAPDRRPLFGARRLLASALRREITTAPGQRSRTAALDGRSVVVIALLTLVLTLSVPLLFRPPGGATPAAIGQGEHIMIGDDGPVFLSFAGKLWEYPDWETVLACTAGHPSWVRKLTDAPGLPRGATLPSIRSHPWLAGGSPLLQARGDSIAYVVVGCVRSRVDHSLRDSLAASGARMLRVSHAVLERMPDGPPALVFPRALGSLIRPRGGSEIRMVTFMGGALQVPFERAVAVLCGDAIVDVDSTEFDLYPPQGELLPSSLPCGEEADSGN